MYPTSCRYLRVWKSSALCITVLQWKVREDYEIRQKTTGLVAVPRHVSALICGEGVSSTSTADHTRVSPHFQTDTHRQEEEERPPAVCTRLPSHTRPPYNPPFTATTHTRVGVCVDSLSEQLASLFPAELMAAVWRTGSIAVVPLVCRERQTERETEHPSFLPYPQRSFTSAAPGCGSECVH